MSKFKDKNTKSNMDIKTNYKDKKYKKVVNGIELQKALNDKDTEIIFLEDGEYNLLNNKITISLDNKIIVGSDGAVFIDEIVIKADAFLQRVKFINKSKTYRNDVIIHILGGAEVVLDGIIIDGCNLEETVGINLEKNSGSKITLMNSYINNVDTGIEVNENNILGKIINNKFSNILIGIKNLGQGSVIENLYNVIYNTFEFKEKGIAIAFSTGVNLGKDKVRLVTDGINFARILSINNGYALVKGYGIFNHISTKTFKVSNGEELDKAIQNSDNGNIILLSKGKYYGNICITKEIAIIGEDDVSIIPSENYDEDFTQYGLRINSSNLFIKNLTIDGKGNGKLRKDICYFRDGIRYEGEINNNNKFVNIHIKNIRRRGISIWPENIRGTEIRNCIVENVLEQQYIYMNGSGKIKNCILNNAVVSICQSMDYAKNKK
ncbi:hypothetical protein [Clostridium lundense]|uniref:hypothetical protein n=1 Tax=Clostridium lundense TaxID=319475 RepID=UPI000A525A4E|nr:hypothetical protein [Clostridium lundense]